MPPSFPTCWAAPHGCRYFIGGGQYCNPTADHMLHCRPQRSDHDARSLDGLSVASSSWAAVLLTTSLIHKVLENAPPIVQLFVCVPIGLGAGAALILLFPRPRRSAFFIGNKISSALKMRFAT